MSLEPELYSLFLSEIEFLERYRARHLSYYPNAPLSREDPDVSRIIEALALFSVRTRQLSRRNVVDMSARLFRQHFSYLLDPVPASARVMALPGRGFADMVVVPRGTTLHLSKKEEPVDGPACQHNLSYRSLASVRVLPLAIDRVDLNNRRKHQHRVEIRVAARHERRDPLGEIPFDIDHLSDFHASLSIFHHLRDRLRRAWIRFDDHGGSEPEEGDEVEVEFGAAEPEVGELRLFDRPLLQIRTFMQNPWVELRMVAKVRRTPSAWRKFTLNLEIGEWPGEVALRTDTFRLNTVPVANLIKELAAPIDCDGTRDRYLVRHADPKAHMTPISILGVYQATSDGLRPMRSATLTGGPGTYEVQMDGQGDARRVWIAPELPDAFEQPARLSVEALWHQPLCRRLGTSAYEAHMADRFLSSVDWELLGDVAPEGEGLEEEDAEALLRLLAIKNQSVLSRDDLLFMLNVLGARRCIYYRDFFDSSLRELTVHIKPYSRGGVSGLKTIYHAVFRGMDESALPRLALVAPHLHRLLEQWCEDDVIDLRVQAPELDFDRIYGIDYMNRGAGTVPSEQSGT